MSYLIEEWTQSCSGLVKAASVVLQGASLPEAHAVIARLSPDDGVRNLKGKPLSPFQETECLSLHACRGPHEKPILELRRRRHKITEVAAYVLYCEKSLASCKHKDVLQEFSGLKHSLARSNYHATGDTPARSL